MSDVGVIICGLIMICAPLFVPLILMFFGFILLKALFKG